MAKQSCSICAAPSDVLAAIDTALKKGEKLRDLEKRTPFSRSTLSRHGRACIPRQTLTNYRRFNPATDKAWVRWPGQPIPAGMRDNDVLLNVVYEHIDPREVGNPPALVSAALVTLAEIEDAERFPKTVPDTSNVPVPNSPDTLLK
jgi:hypothetical protein